MEAGKGGEGPVPGDPGIESGGGSDSSIHIETRPEGTATGSDENASSAGSSSDTVPLLPPAHGDVMGEVLAGPGPVPVTPVRPPQNAVVAFLRTVFLGPNGIRAGWRLLIFFLLFAGLMALVQVTAVRIFGRPQRGQQLPPKLMILFELFAFVVAVIASGIMAKIEKETWGHYGLPLRRAISRDFWFGCLWGIVALSCILGVLHLAGAYYIDGLALRGGAIVKWGMAWGAMFLLVGLFEEFIIRGYLLYTLASGIRFWPAAVITSSLFLVGHVRNPGENWWGLADVFVIGMFFCFTLWRTGDLWFAVGLHAVWDWGQSFLYSVPDSGLVVPGHLFKMHMSGPAWLSGGTVGPEGSMLNLILDLLFFVVFAAFYNKRKWLGTTERRQVRNEV